MVESSHGLSRGRVLGCGFGRGRAHLKREGESAQCQAIAEPRGADGGELHVASAAEVAGELTSSQHAPARGDETRPGRASARREPRRQPPPRTADEPREKLRAARPPHATPLFALHAGRIRCPDPRGAAPDTMAADDQAKFAIHEACREGRSTRQTLPRSELRLADILRSRRRGVSAERMSCFPPRIPAAPLIACLTRRTPSSRAAATTMSACPSTGPCHTTVCP